MEFVTTSTEDYDYTDYPNITDFENDTCIDAEGIWFGSLVTPIFFTIIFMLSFVGNVLVLWILVKYENLRSLTNFFLMNLIVSDLLFTAGLPFWAWYYIQNWTFGDVSCKLVSFVFYLGFYSSLIFLTMVTIHRYMAVMHPLSIALKKNLYYNIMVSVLSWFLSVCAAIPEITFKGLITIDKAAHCDYLEVYDNWKLFGIYQQNIFFLVAFITIGYCYICILGRLLRPMSHTRPKTVKLILCIVMLFFTGWIPYNVTIFLCSLITWEVSPFNKCPVIHTLNYIHSVSRLIAFSHCCLNPVFYFFVGIKFRRHLKNMLKNVCGHKEQFPSHHGRIHSNREEISMY